MTQEQTLSPSRRRWVVGGVALAAVAGGAWVAWEQTKDMASNDEALQAFWALQLTQPDGSTLALSTLRGKPLIVNFWATWCPPCVRELPMINRFAQAQAARGAHAGVDGAHARVSAPPFGCSVARYGHAHVGYLYRPVL